MNIKDFVNFLDFIDDLSAGELGQLKIRIKVIEARRANAVLFPPEQRADNENDPV